MYEFGLHLLRKMCWELMCDMNVLFNRLNQEYDSPVFHYTCGAFGSSTKLEQHAMIS